MSKGGGQGSFAQMQEPGLDMGGFGGQPQPAVSAAPSFAYSVDDQNFGNIQEARQYAFDTYGNLDSVRAYEPPPVEQPAPMPAPAPMQNQGPNNISGGFGSKGGRFNPYQTDSIVPPGRTAGLPNQTGGIVPDFMLDRSRGGPKGGGRVYAGGNPNFNERTGQFRTGGFKPPRGPVKFEPIKMQPFPVDTGMPPPRTPPPRPTFPRTGGSMPVERVNVPAIPDDMLADLESRGTVGPRSPNPDAPFGMGSKGGRGGGRGMASGIGGKGGRGDPVGTGSFEDMINRGRFSPGSRGRDDRVYAGGNPNFDEFTGRYRSPPFNPRGRPPFMPGPKPPVFGPPRPVPGRNTQFQMPFFGSQYGRMNPYAGQFSGYGVPSNIYGFDQPHYQPYVPPPPAQSAPPVMQLPPDQGGNQAFSGAPVAYTPPPPVSFGGGYGGIGGFGRYNLGLAGSQFR